MLNISAFCLAYVQVQAIVSIYFGVFNVWEILISSKNVLSLTTAEIFGQIFWNESRFPRTEDAILFFVDAHDNEGTGIVIDLYFSNRLDRASNWWQCQSEIWCVTYCCRKEKNTTKPFF